MEEWPHVLCSIDPEESNMACPTCDHTMSHLGETVDGPYRRVFWWCPRCGTIRTDSAGAFDDVPKLVNSCREFAANMKDYHATMLEYRRVGITESINVPAERSSDATAP